MLQCVAGELQVTLQSHLQQGYRDSLLETAQEAVAIAATRVHR